MKSVLGVASSGGHLDQLVSILLPLEGTCSLAIASFDKEDAQDKKARFRFYSLRYPTNRAVVNNVLNLFRAFRAIKREKPDFIISTGAAPAVPFALIAKLTRRNFIYVEPIDRVVSPTMTAKILRILKVEFVVYWPSQLSDYPNRHYLT